MLDRVWSAIRINASRGGDWPAMDRLPGTVAGRLTNAFRVPLSYIGYSNLRYSKADLDFIRSVRIRWLQEMFGEHITSSNDLTEGEARAVLFFLDSAGCEDFLFEWTLKEVPYAE